MSGPRILLVRLGALGDVILTLPAARLLRRSLPEAELVWLVERRNAPILEQNADIDGYLVVRADDWRERPLAPATLGSIVKLGRELRRRRFDLALDLQGLVKSAFLARLSGAPRRLGLPASRTRERLGGLLLTERAAERGRHVTDLYLGVAAAAIEALGARPAPLTTTAERDLIRLSPAERDALDLRLKAERLGEFVVLNPGAGWVTKQWGAERYGALARRLSEELRISVIVAHGAGEETLARTVVTHAASEDVRAYPSDVRELAGLLSRARLLIAGDTGPYHLAGILGTPTLGLFGPTDPALNGPRSETDAVIWGKVACAPCYGRRCPTQIECMASIDVDAVVRGARAQLERARRDVGGSAREPTPPIRARES